MEGSSRADKAGPSNSLYVKWGNRDQHYTWANNIEYEYGRSSRQTVVINVVIVTRNGLKTTATARVRQKKWKPDMPGYHPGSCLKRIYLTGVRKLPVADG